MENQVNTSVRLPRSLVREIKRIAKQEGSTCSQFIRSTVIKEMNTRKQVAA